jgi:diguanylate cyclase (GGDEF)-like protein/PAS domain S-box-containing protein
MPENERSNLIQLVLKEIAEAAVLSASLDELYAKVHESVQKVLPAKNFYFIMLDASERQFVIPYCVDETHAIPRQRPVGKGMADYVMRERRAVYITPDKLAQLRDSGEVEIRLVDYHKWAGAPLIDSKGKPFGVVALFLVAEETLALQEEDLEILSIIAAQVSMAIERKKVMEALVEERNLLLTLVDSIPDRIFVKDRQCRFVLNNLAHIKALGAQTQAEVSGKTDFDFRPVVLARRSFVDDKKVMDENAPLINYEEQTLFSSGEQGTILVSKVPYLGSTGEVAGLIGISRDITEQKKASATLQEIANELEIKVEERTQELVGVNEELTAMNEEMSAINQTLEEEVALRREKEDELFLRERQNRAIAGLLMSPVEQTGELLQTILQNALQLIGAPEGFIGLYDENRNEFVVHYAVGGPAEYIGVAQPGDAGLRGQVVLTGKTQWVEDYRTYKHKGAYPYLARVTTNIAVPLRQGEKTIGCISANWQDVPHALTLEQREILEQYGNFASVALDRERIQARITQANQLLRSLAHTTTTVIGQLDIDVIFREILESASNLVGVPHGFIQILTPDGKALQYKAAKGNYADKVGGTVPIGGISAIVLQTGELYYVEDYHAWPARMTGPFFDDITMGVQAPLKVDGKTVGSISLAAFSEPIVLDDEKLDILNHFSKVASIAYKNALLHKEAIVLAYHDTLTGLPNRASLSAKLHAEMNKAKQSDASGAVLFIDLDDLKVVNDNFGHSFGDAVIISAGFQIVQKVGQEAFVARIGGDEFIVILPGERSRDEVAMIAEALVKDLSQDYEVAGESIHLSASLGAAFYPADGNSAEAILKNADSAMYAAKNSGKNCWRFYERQIGEESYTRMLLSNSLRKALERDELFLHFQAQVSCDKRRVVGFEALLRWNSAEHGFVSPDQFIPLAEQGGMILPIGRFVLDKACSFVRYLNEIGFPSLRVAVNISPRQLAAESFVEDVRQSIVGHGIEAGRLELEVTENVLIESMEDSINKLLELKALGVCLALDDFGTGYSSLTYLRHLPVDVLKIDKTFIDPILVDASQERFVRFMIEMAHSLNLQVVAEGVEEKLQVTKLERLGCDIIQGYVYSKPAPIEEAIRLLDERHVL